VEGGIAVDGDEDGRGVCECSALDGDYFMSWVVLRVDNAVFCSDYSTHLEALIVVLWGEEDKFFAG